MAQKDQSIPTKEQADDYTTEQGSNNHSDTNEHSDSDSDIIYYHGSAC